MEQIRFLAAGCGLSGDDLAAMFRLLDDEAQP